MKYKYKMVIKCSAIGHKWEDAFVFPNGTDAEIINTRLKSIRASHPNNKYKVVKRRIKCI